MKILIIGGMHGNEPLGLELIALCKQKPIPEVSLVAANQRAIAAGQRFVAQDLNRSFPGNRRSDTYEVRRAAELIQKCRDFDLVLDFHNTHCPDNDCGFVGQTADTSLYDAARWLGLQRLIVADYDCLN